MKIRSVVLVSALTVLAGCKSASNLFSPGWVLLNNTHYSLEVYQDGKYFTNLTSGRVARLPYNWREHSLVSVSARNDSGEFVGSSSHTFSEFSAHVWQLDTVVKPGWAE